MTGPSQHVEFPCCYDCPLMTCPLDFEVRRFNAASSIVGFQLFELPKFDHQMCGLSFICCSKARALSWRMGSKQRCFSERNSTDRGSSGARGRGKSTLISSMIRPELALMIKMRSARNTASSMSEANEFLIWIDPLAFFCGTCLCDRNGLYKAKDRDQEGWKKQLP